MRQKRKTSYPKHLLPRSEYHRIPTHRKLNRLMLLRLMRNVDMPDKGIIDRDTMALYMKDGEFYGGMSVSLLCRFKKKDAKWWINDRELTDYWDFKSTVPTIPAESLKFNKNQGFFGFRINDIERIASTFTVYNKNGDEVRTDNLSCKVIHAPTKVNFWHFNIFLIGEEMRSDNTIRTYFLHEEYSKRRVSHIASQVMDDFYSILKTKHELKVYSIPKPFYRKGDKWKKLKNTLLENGVINSIENGY